MVRRSNPVEKAARMLDLVPYIISHQGIAISELAQEFGVSEEELLTDLNALWMCGDSQFDLIDLNFESGYVTIRPAESLNLIRSLSKQKIISLLIGLNLLDQDISGASQEVKLDISQLKAKLGNEITRMVSAVPAIDSSIVLLIKKAIESRTSVRIEYYSPTDDEISHRDISPLDLFTEGRHDFLLAYCDSAKSHRTFRLDRIRSAVQLDMKPSQIPHLQDQDGRRYESVKIHRNKRWSREALGANVLGEGQEVEVLSYNPEWLLRTVISAAGALEVTSSPELRQQIVSKAATALALYR